MSFRISAPEILIVASCPMFLSGQAIVASVFLSLGVLGAITRVVLDTQRRQENIKLIIDLVNNAVTVTNATLESIANSMLSNSNEQEDSEEPEDPDNTYN